MKDKTPFSFCLQGTKMQIAVGSIIILLLLLYFTRNLFKSVSRFSNNTTYIFYAPWCGHCKRNMSEFEKAASKNENVILIDSDLDTSKELLEKYSIQGFPSIVKADGTKYSGDRTAESILAFAKS